MRWALASMTGSLGLSIHQLPRSFTLVHTQVDPIHPTTSLKKQINARLPQHNFQRIQRSVFLDVVSVVPWLKAPEYFEDHVWCAGCARGTKSGPSRVMLYESLVVPELNNEKQGRRSKGQSSFPRKHDFSMVERVCKCPLCPFPPLLREALSGLSDMGWNYQFLCLISTSVTVDQHRCWWSLMTFDDIWWFAMIWRFYGGLKINKSHNVRWFRFISWSGIEGFETWNGMPSYGISFGSQHIL